MKKILINTILITAGLVAVPTIILGIGHTRSLILDKTPEEAVVIVADRVDEVDGKVEVVKEKVNTQEEKNTAQDQSQAALQEAQQQIEAMQASLGSLVAELESKNQQLTTELETQKTITQEIQSSPALQPAPDPVRKLVLSSRYWVSRGNILTEGMGAERMMSIRFESKGDSPVCIQAITFEFEGYQPVNGIVKSIKILTGADALIAEAPYEGGQTRVAIDCSSNASTTTSIQPGKSADRIMAVEMGDDLWSADGQNLILRISGLESNATLPVYSTFSSNTFTVKSIKEE